MHDLRKLSRSAALAECIALDLQPQVLSTSIETLEMQSLDHLQAVGQQQTRSETRLAVWLCSVANAGALTHQQATTFVFVDEAATLGGPSGVAPE